MKSPAHKEMLKVVKRFGMDDEDLAKMRAEGIKCVADFHRIKNVNDLGLPAGFETTDSTV